MYYVFTNIDMAKCKYLKLYLSNSYTQKTQTSIYEPEEILAWMTQKHWKIRSTWLSQTVKSPSRNFHDTVR
jgi:hypothetical protein